MTATMPAVGATLISLRRLNSSPSENISSMTPSSDSVCVSGSSTNSGTGRCGPDDDARQQVAEHDRLAQPLEHHRRHRGDAQDQREIGQQIDAVRGHGRWSL